MILTSDGFAIEEHHRACWNFTFSRRERSLPRASLWSSMYPIVGILVRRRQRLVSRLPLLGSNLAVKRAVHPIKLVAPARRGSRLTLSHQHP